MNTVAWTAILLSIIAALSVCALVLEKLVSIAARIKGVEAEQATQYTRLGDYKSELCEVQRAAKSRDDAMATRLDALEKRPPITNVTVQMLPQTPALKPKAGTK